MNKVKKTVLNNIGFIVDDESGEIIKPAEGDYRIVLQEFFKDDTPKEEKQVDFSPKNDFMKLYKGINYVLFKELSHSELALVVMLSGFISYGDCALGHGGHGNGNYLTNEDISKYSGFKEDTVKKMMYSLRDKGVIGIHNVEDSKQKKWYSVNPYIFCKGAKVQRRIIDYYKNTIWADAMKSMIVISEE